MIVKDGENNIVIMNPQNYESGDDKKGLPDPIVKSTRTSFDARRKLGHRLMHVDENSLKHQERIAFGDHDPSSKQSLEASVQSGEVFYLDNFHTGKNKYIAQYSKYKIGRAHV